MHLIATINKAFGTDLPLIALFQAPTVEKLAEILSVDAEAGPATWSSLVLMQPTGSRPPLFFLPGNLGNVFNDLGDLAHHLGPDQPFYGLQDSAQNPVRIEALATHYLDEIRAVRPKGPYLLGGVCSGAVVAYEMAQQLQAQGKQVALLALVEPSHPEAPSLRAYLGLGAWEMGRLFRRFGRHASRIAEMPAAEQKGYLRLKLKVWANDWAVTHYAPVPYQGRLDLFLTDESLRIHGNPQLGWRELAVPAAEVHEFPGNHATIVGLDVPIEETHMQALAAKLRARIDHVLSNG